MLTCLGCGMVLQAFARFGQGAGIVKSDAQFCQPSPLECGEFGRHSICAISPVSTPHDQRCRDNCWDDHLQVKHAVRTQCSVPKELLAIFGSMSACLLGQLTIYTIGPVCASVPGVSKPWSSLLPRVFSGPSDGFCVTSLRHPCL